MPQATKARGLRRQATCRLLVAAAYVIGCSLCVCDSNLNRLPRHHLSCLQPSFRACHLSSLFFTTSTSTYLSFCSPSTFTFSSILSLSLLSASRRLRLLQFQPSFPFDRVLCAELACSQAHCSLETEWPAELLS